MTLRERLQQAKHEAQGRTWSHEDDFILWFVEREIRAERMDTLAAADRKMGMHGDAYTTVLRFFRDDIKRGRHRTDGDPLAERRDET